MKKAHIVELFSIMGFEKIKTTVDGWVMCSCPFAPWFHESGKDGNPSFGVSIGEVSHYHCFSCQKSGMLTILPTALSMLSGRDDLKAREFVAMHESVTHGNYEDDTNENMCITPISKELLTKKSLTRATVRQYGKRGITNEEAEYRRLCYDRAENRLVFPVFWDGHIVGIRGRALDNREPRYRSYSEIHADRKDPKGMGAWYGGRDSPNLIPNKALVLVEGEIDAILLHQTGQVHNVWASMGASISRAQMKTLQGVTAPLVLFFDNDKAGEQAKHTVARKMKGLVPLYHVTDYCGCKDPGEIVERGKAKRALFSLDKYL